MKISKHICTIALLLVVVACTSNKPLTIASLKSQGGETVIVALNEKTAAPQDSLKVFIGGVYSDIVHQTADSAEVLVPQLKPGKYKITARYGNNTVSEGEITILEHANLQLILQMEGDDIKVVSRQSTNTQPDTNNQYSPLSFQLMSGNQMFAKGIARTPSSTEIFADPSGKITRRNNRSPTFLIIVPNLKGVSQLQLFKDTGLATHRLIAPPNRIPWKTIAIQNN